MALSDREYMRNDSGGSGAPQWAPKSVVNTLILLNAVVFLMTSFNVPPTEALAMNPAHLGGARLISIFTALFVHADLMHIVMNMYLLYLFGKGVESLIGSRRFLAMYILSGLIGNACFLALNWNEYLFGLGASGAVFGVMAAAYLLTPNQELMLLIPPIPLRMKTLVLITVGVETFYLLTLKESDGIAHIAHLGGFVGGYLFIRVLLRGGSERAFGRRRGPNPIPFTRVPPPRPAAPRPVLVPADEDTRIAGPETDLNTQIDSILDKIGKHGIKSLTRKEREILDRARERFNKEMS